MRRQLWTLAALSTLIAACATHPPRANTAKTDAPLGQDVRAQEPEAIFQQFQPAQVERIVAAQPYVEAAATEYDLEAELIYGVIWVESRFQPRAKSPAGARGLMQLMPQTAAALAKQLGVSRPRSYDPEFNVTAGAYYLRRLLDRYEGDEILALAAYNAGSGNVNKWREQGKPLPDYSKKYVSAVLEARARFRGTPLDAEREQMLANAKPSAPVAPTPQPDPPKPEPVQPPAEATPPPTTPDPVDDYEPVFVERPDLDAHPASVARPEEKPRAPRRIDSRATGSSPDVGVGVLPSVGE
jgi:hypothetical protein